MKRLAPLFLCLIIAACASVPQKDAKKDVTTQAEEAAVNPFFEAFKTPFGSPPFDLIRDEHYLPAIEKGLAEGLKEIQTIADKTEPATFANTVGALDKNGVLLDRVLGVFYVVRAAHTNDKLEEIAKVVAPKLSAFQDDITLNEKLFARIKAVHQSEARKNLSREENRLLDEWYKKFIRGGAMLDAPGKKRLRAINEELSLLNLAFGQNILKETNRFGLLLDKKEDLAGLPERVVTAAAKAAEKDGHKGKWKFTIHKPSLLPFLQYAQQRALREKMFKAYVGQGDHGDDLDNKANVVKIALLRLEKAKLLGFSTYAHYALDKRMAPDPESVDKLLKQLWTPALKVAKKEAAALQALIDAEGGKFKLQPWDWWFYAEKQRKAEFDLDEKELRPYFKLDNVLKGAFDVAHKLYGLSFTELKDIPVYHPDVRVFEVKEADGSHLGVLYTDYFPRASKRGGAWCGGFRDQSYKNGKRVAPLVTNTGNFSMPSGDKPALLSLDEVLTLFHEFGHGLHFLLADAKYQGSANAIRTDFVELPSQIMENWALEPEVLKLYAHHYETGKLIPDALVAKLEKSRYFNQGFETVEYLAASFLDMDWHLIKAKQELDAKAFETASLAKIGLIPEIVSRYRSPYFRHVFAGNFYAAGYYSYIWAAVLDADAFEAFKEKGLFDQETAKAFRKLLSTGGAEDPMVLYKTFRGAEPSIEPLLKRRGLK